MNANVFFSGAALIVLTACETVVNFSRPVTDPGEPQWRTPIPMDHGTLDMAKLPSEGHSFLEFQVTGSDQRAVVVGVFQEDGERRVYGRVHTGNPRNGEGWSHPSSEYTILDGRFLPAGANFGGVSVGVSPKGDLLTALMKDDLINPGATSRLLGADAKFWNSNESIPNDTYEKLDGNKATTIRDVTRSTPLHKTSSLLWDGSGGAYWVSKKHSGHLLLRRYDSEEGWAATDKNIFLHGAQHVELVHDGFNVHVIAQSELGSIWTSDVESLYKEITPKDFDVKGSFQSASDELGNIVLTFIAQDDRLENSKPHPYAMTKKHNGGWSKPVRLNPEWSLESPGGDQLHARGVHVNSAGSNSSVDGAQYAPPSVVKVAENQFLVAYQARDESIQGQYDRRVYLRSYSPIKGWQSAPSLLFSEVEKADSMEERQLFNHLRLLSNGVGKTLLAGMKYSKRHGKGWLTPTVVDIQTGVSTSLEGACMTKEKEWGDNGAIAHDKPDPCNDLPYIEGHIFPNGQTVLVYGGPKNSLEPGTGLTDDMRLFTAEFY